MRRDHDYIRQMMLDLEDSDDTVLVAVSTINPSAEAQKRCYHADLLCDAGMLTELNSGVYRMTSHGHDYLDAIRDDTNWKRAKKVAGDAGGVTIGMMFDISMHLLKERLSTAFGG